MTLLDSWLDLVHGSACLGCSLPGRLLCRACERTLPRRARRVRPTPCPPGLAPCLAAGEYAGLLGALVVAHKEHAAYSLTPVLGGLLATAVGPVAARAGPTSLVPVPSRPAVVRARGHDPVLRAARVACRRLQRSGHDVRVRQLLRQVGPVRDQSGLSARERATNLVGSMRAAHPSYDGVVVLCDDVLTTGATAREAQRALEAAGVPVRAVATVAATRKQVADTR